MSRYKVVLRSRGQLELHLELSPRIPLHFRLSEMGENGLGSRKDTVFIICHHSERKRSRGVMGVML